MVQSRCTGGKRLKLKKMIDKTLALYLLVGVLNFIVCTGIMFLLYNVSTFLLDQYQ